MPDTNSHTWSGSDRASRVLVEAMSEGALVLTCEGTIVYCNHAFAKMLGLATNQVHGCAIYSFIKDHDIERFRNLLVPFTTNAQIETTFGNCDSHSVPTIVSIGNFEVGGKLSFYLIVKDLTDFKKLEDKLEVRTKQLEASNRDFESFACSVSHDLRAQLRHINNFTEILIEHLQGTMDNQSRHYLDVISHAASEMNILIDQLLYLFRIGISAASIERVDLNVLVNRVVNSFGQETVDRQIEWDIDNLPDVSGDLEMLQTVFSCLVSNALKFTRLQPVAKIKIAVEPGLADNSNVVLSIEDNGLGFDMQHKDKIFDMFQRMHNQKDFEGTGIGLANVKRIIQRHGGSVWAEGELNKGAKFYISLPKFENH